MVAEPTLFLSKDRELQVRAFTTKSGKEVFCVKDFIRATSKKVMGPDDAMIYWLSSLMKLLHEREVIDSRMVQFLGPYEKPEVCISAAGLLVLYHHLSSRFDLVEEAYRTEVQDVLADIVSSKSAKAYVEMHDDGEVDDQLAEMGDERWTRPPAGSKYEYRDEVDGKEMGGDEMNQVILSFNERLKLAEEERNKAVNDLIRKLEAEKLASQKAKAKLSGYAADEEARKRKRTGFTAASVIEEKKWVIENRGSFCKSIVSAFKARFPSGKTFVRHGAVHFYSEDRPMVELLLQEAYDRYLFETE